MRYSEKGSSTLELKREVPRYEQIIKTMIGFCNQSGGKIVLGVSDDGQIIGLPDDVIEKVMSDIDKAIYEAAMPPVIPRVYTQRFDQKAVVVIEVSEGMTKPYYRKSEGLAKGTYMRLGRNTIRATSAMIDELKWQSCGVDFETLPAYRFTREDLDDQAIQSFLNSRANQAKASVTDNLLKSYGLITREHQDYLPTIAGMLLFGKNPQQVLSEAMIICSHFKGTSGREAIATVDCEGTLFHQFEQVYAFILSRLYKSFTITNVKREEKLEIPEVALREVLFNALIHRNYHIPGPIKVAIYDDRIEVFSPGGFPGPMSPDSLLQGITYLRNPAICKIFREAGYVEKLGTGFITIFDSYHKHGLADPQVIQGDNFIKCILPRFEKSTQPDEPEDQQILRLFDSMQEITIQDIVNQLQVSRATASRRINELIDKGLLERIGKTRSVRYRKV